MVNANFEALLISLLLVTFLVTGLNKTVKTTNKKVITIHAPPLKLRLECKLNLESSALRLYRS